ncbi:MAG TPA: hypothetical protein VFQ53_13245 [Kofleriaceae bacterium]|nr:hypothetical protein [Kofleriaceae bacterium]
MSRIAELEAALQARWDRDTLSVYADALEQQGDPRGELIRLELARISPTSQRRRGLLAAWLGDELDVLERSCTFAFGFVDDFYVPLAAQASQTSTSIALERLLHGPAGRYLRGLTLSGDPDEVDHQLALLAAAERPWLRRLEIHRFSDAPIASEQLAAIVPATPHLDELVLCGRHVARPPLHPGITTLRLEAGTLVVDDSSVLPQIRVLDLELRRAPAGDRSLELAAVSRTPALRVLDLSRNERDNPLPYVSLVPQLRTLDGIGRLERIRLPAQRMRDEIASVVAMLDRHPQLHVDVARRYRCFEDAFAGVAHDRLTVAEPRPFPPLDLATGEIRVVGRYASKLASLDALVHMLEDQWDGMDADARDACRALFDTIDALPRDEFTEDGDPVGGTFPVATLRAVIDACHDDWEGVLAMIDANLETEDFDRVELQVM